MTTPRTTQRTPPGDLPATSQAPGTAVRPLSAAERRAADVIAARKAASASGTVSRRDATGESIERRADPAAAALAANAEAMAKARFFVALQRPRDLEVARESLLSACAEPEFADEATWELERYDAKKREKVKISGFSVRFAEAVRQSLGNTDVDTHVVWDDDERLLLQVVVTDLETNNTERAPVVVRKRTERRRLKDGQVPIETRRGSEGQTIHIVASTDDEIVEATNRGVAKAMRNAVLRLLRVDIKQACWEQLQATTKVAARAEGAATKIVGRLAELGVSAAQIEAFLGHRPDRLSVDEYKRLGGIGRAISDGEATWVEATGLAPDQDGAGGEVDYSKLPDILSDPVEQTAAASTAAPTRQPGEDDDQAAAQGGAQSRDEMISACTDLALRAGFELGTEWDECAAYIKKSCGGNPPASLNKCTNLQIEKLHRWLRVKAMGGATQQ